MLWNVPMEDKVEEAKTFADIVHILIHYGADVATLTYKSSKASDDWRRYSALSLLIRKVSAVTLVDSSELHRKLSRYANIYTSICFILYFIIILIVFF